MPSGGGTLTERILRLEERNPIKGGKNPLNYLDQAVISVTNPPPYVEEWEEEKIKGFYLHSMSMIEFSHPGFSTYALSVSTSPPYSTCYVWFKIY
ncbi:MAG: hypothetical protein QXS27_07245 [Candidatus Jordarchaeaceae archaeon]